MLVVEGGPAFAPPDDLSARADITLPKVNKDLLIDEVSLNVAPVDWLSLSLSLPAKSTNVTFPFRANPKYRCCCCCFMVAALDGCRVRMAEEADESADDEDTCTGVLSMVTVRIA